MNRLEKKLPVASRGAVATSGTVSEGKPVAAGPPTVAASLSPEQLERAKRHAPGRPVRRPTRTKPLGTTGELDEATVASLRLADSPGGTTPGVATKASPILLAIVHALREERERQKLTLADVSVQCGIEKGALSKLENGQNPNPTFETLQRYARSLGKELTLGAVAPGQVEIPDRTLPSNETVVGYETAHGVLQRLAHSPPEDCRRFEEFVLSMLMMAWASGVVDPARDLQIPVQDIPALYASTFHRLVERGVPFVGKEQLHRIVDLASAES
jgi:transcriptional regulator with XRE-family HTH domain